MANRAIRAPHYTSTHDDGVQYTDLDRGLQWGADAIPALLGLFAVEPDTREDESSGWVAFARHWRGATMRLAFDLFSDHDESDPVVVVTAIAGRAGEDPSETTSEKSNSRTKYRPNRSGRTEKNATRRRGGRIPPMEPRR
ncbi:hypothetical protein [Haladaptatus sp. GCM10025707]|uniref:hypothetical protein n=1 Tax=Haladaptatus sp. GCM10025707 TaxID=3252658 RepID=UPI0036F3AA7D